MDVVGVLSEKVRLRARRVAGGHTEAGGHMDWPLEPSHGVTWTWFEYFPRRSDCARGGWLGITWTGHWSLATGVTWAGHWSLATGVTWTGHWSLATGARASTATYASSPDPNWVTIYVYVYTYTYMYVYIHVYIHTHTHVYTYMYVYIHVYIHTHAHTHTH